MDFGVARQSVFKRQKEVFRKRPNYLCLELSEVKMINFYFEKFLSKVEGKTGIIRQVDHDLRKNSTPCFLSSKIFSKIIKKRIWKTIVTDNLDICFVKIS